MKLILSCTSSSAFRNAKMNLNRIILIDEILRDIQMIDGDIFDYTQIESKIAERIDLFPAVQPPSYRPLPITFEFDSEVDEEIDIRTLMLAEPIENALNDILNCLSRPVYSELEFIATNENCPIEQAAIIFHNQLADSYGIDAEEYQPLDCAPTVQDYMWLYRLIIERIVKIQGIEELLEIDV